ncbi:MAG: TonB family protein, partial [Nitrospirota bacterium]|nr:TonB family protein [Nitrospirota bacterium]
YSLREKLYDPKVIGDIAMKGGGGQPKKDDSVTFDTSDYRYAGYMRKLKAKIESIWVYPPEAMARGLYGDLKVRFTIRKDGRLGAVELVRTSGYKMLDDAAIRALKDGEPYWPLPEEWGMESYSILGHFVYSLYGYSLR